jgi:hypothetical protein
MNSFHIKKRIAAESGAIEVAGMIAIDSCQGKSSHGQIVCGDPPTDSIVCIEYMSSRVSIGVMDLQMEKQWDHQGWKVPPG